MLDQACRLFKLQRHFMHRAAACMHHHQHQQQQPAHECNIIGMSAQRSSYRHQNNVGSKQMRAWVKTKIYQFQCDATIALLTLTRHQHLNIEPLMIDLSTQSLPARCRPLFARWLAKLKAFEFEFLSRDLHANRLRLRTWEYNYRWPLPSRRLESQ